MLSERWWTIGGPIPAQRLVCFVNPQGVAGLSIQELVYWEVWGGQFGWGKGGTENNNLLPASCGDHGEDGLGGFVTMSAAPCQSQHIPASKLHLAYSPLGPE